MVSIAMLVFPVCRSPIISSRWPRPIGIIVSIALIPVKSGSLTLSRFMTPGAILSIGLVFSYVKGPTSSIGIPKALTTRPKRPSPTGTSTTRPVDLTVSPSLTSSSPLRTTALTVSRLRFITIPRISCGKSKSSPNIACFKP